MPLTFFYPEYEKEDVASGICEGSSQETTGTERAVQKEHSTSTDETVEEVR